MKIATIVPVHNRKAYIENLLAQIEEQQKVLDESVCLRLVVVDDGSTDGTSELIQRKFPSVYIVEGNGKLWWTGAIVKGMDYAIKTFDPDFFLWLNDDISLDVHFLKNLNEVCHQAHIVRQMTGGIVRDTTYDDWIVYSGQQNGRPICDFSKFETLEAVSADTLAGNITLISRQIVDTVGLPDSAHFPHHGGDYTYAKRVKQAGFELAVNCTLQATTEYRLADLIRYMPYWMQWRLAIGTKERLKIIRGLTSLKANQNIWLFVHLQKADNPIFIWDYLLCYVSKLVKLMTVSLMPKDRFYIQLKRYLEAWNSPPELWMEHPLFKV